MQLGKRSRYFLSHLFCSIFIACMVLALIFCVWYPTPLAKAVGVSHILFMLIGIDLVIGPILSFIVYKEGKKTLVFDLSVIIVLQLCALGYGLYNIAQGRPAWLVYYKNSYELIRHSDVVAPAGQAVSSPWLGPQYTAVKLSQDPQKYDEELTLELKGYSLAQFQERHIAWSKAKDDMQKYAIPVQQLTQFNDSALVQAQLQKYPQASYFFPLKALEQDMTVLIDKEYKIIKIVDLRPWN